MNFDSLLHEKMRSLGAATYKRFLRSELIYHWGEIIDDSIAAQVEPVELEHGILFVDVKNSAFKDQLKFYREEIIDAINENFGQELVKDIRIAQGFRVADKLPDRNSAPAQVADLKSTLGNITLTAEEIKNCEEQSEKISNEDLRRTVLQTLLSQARSQKYKLAQGWHKCLKCESLCAADEIFCEVCKIKERERMNRELYNIFYDSPYLRAQDAQKILLEKMPQMQKECSLDVIESARTSLIQKIASKVRYGDEESPEVLKLVALEKRLPLEKLTPAIIRRTLIDLQFNLSEQPKLQRYLANKKNAPS